MVIFKMMPFELGGSFFKYVKRIEFLQAFLTGFVLVLSSFVYKFSYFESLKFCATEKTVEITFRTESTPSPVPEYFFSFLKSSSVMKSDENKVEVSSRAYQNFPVY